MIEGRPTGVRTREPIEQGKQWEFVSNFNLVLEEHGLTHDYFVDGPRRFGMELSDMMSFTRHEILQPVQRRVLGRKLWTSHRRVARILSDSARDPGPSVFSRVPHYGLQIGVIKPEDRQLVDSVIDALHQIYPDEPVRVYNE